MKILALVSLALLAAFVQADMPTAEEVALAKQTRICIDMGNDFKTCCEKLGDKLDKFDLVHFLSVVNYEAVLNELREFLEVYKTGKHTIRETLAIMKQNGKQKRDVASTVNELKDKVVKEFEELKAAAAAAKEKFEACAKEPGKNYFVCAKELAEQKFKETFGKQKRDVSGKFDEIKAAIEKEFDELKTSVTAAKDKFEACAKEPGKNYFICAKEMAEQKIKETFGRRKRSGNDVAWYPSAEEVAAAKQIKICLDMGKDKSECYAKVLGANIDKFDHVKLETITKYEDVLRELRQFLDIRNKGECKTIRECLLALHKAQTAVKNRAFIPQNVQDLINLKTVVLECMAAAQENNVAKCAVALLGPQVAGSDYVTMIQQLVNHPAVQEFAKGAGQKLHAYLTTLDGVVAQIHNYAHATYDWVMSNFG